MSTWLAKLQAENAEVDTVERFGWTRDPDPENPVITGFSAGTKSFMADGKHKETVRIKAEHEQIGRLYRPMGRIDEWKVCADYLTVQNNPAFTAILASAFATPLIAFAGLPGAVLSIVSTESGVGKTSAMKVAQSVWGAPTKAMNSTADTPLSITRKIGFLNNLPAYWDEIRGTNALDNFYTVAFDVAQGKEKTRLTQQATLREIHDWQTMVIGASNESLFDHMALKGGQSNASIARTFEITIPDGSVVPDLNTTAMFGAVELNYGHAGQIYAEHLARNHKVIERRVNKALDGIREWSQSGGERFWCAIIAILITGAIEAKECGICDIDINTLASFLRDNLAALRRRTGSAMSTTSGRELIGDYTQQFQAGEMIIDAHPQPRQRGYQPVITKSPGHGAALMYVRAGDIYRFRKNDFIKWLRISRQLQYASVEAGMIAELNMVEITTKLGLGSNVVLANGKVLEVDLSPPPVKVVP